MNIPILDLLILFGFWFVWTFIVVWNFIYENSKARFSTKYVVMIVIALFSPLINAVSFLILYAIIERCIV
jgi:hypothetical protein